jgi:hypothetical protein
LEALEEEEDREDHVNWIQVAVVQNAIHPDLNDPILHVHSDALMNHTAEKVPSQKEEERPNQIEVVAFHHRHPAKTRLVEMAHCWD